MPSAIRGAPSHPARPRRPPVPASDRDRGLSLLCLFTSATAVMTGAVLLASAADSWWILILTTALLGVTTFAVFAGIMRLLADEGVDDDP